MHNIPLLDVVVIAAYFLILLGIGYWAARREKNVSADYFLASRDVGWLAVGASLFASNIGSEHLVGLAGTGAASGLAVGHFEWLACFMLLLLGWLFVPFYLRSGVYTMPEFLERRFNPAARSYFTWVSIIGYVLTKISVTLFAGGIVRRADPGRLVLVHRPAYRAAGARGQERQRRPHGHHLRRVSEDPAGVHLRAAGDHRRGVVLGHPRRVGRCGVPGVGHAAPAGRVQGPGAGRDARRADELARLRVQLLLDAAHVGRVPQAAARRERAAARGRRTDHHGPLGRVGDRKSTRLNSSHTVISY